MEIIYGLQGVESVSNIATTKTTWI